MGIQGLPSTQENREEILGKKPDFWSKLTHPCDSSTAAPHELPPSVKSPCYAGAHPTCQNVHKTPAETEVWRSPWIPAGWWFTRGCYRAACSSLATEHPTHKYRRGGGWSDTSLGSRRGEHLSAFRLNTGGVGAVSMQPLRGLSSFPGVRQHILNGNSPPLG